MNIPALTLCLARLMEALAHDGWHVEGTTVSSKGGYTETSHSTDPQQLLLDLNALGHAQINVLFRHADGRPTWIKLDRGHEGTMPSLVRAWSTGSGFRELVNEYVHRAEFYAQREELYHALRTIEDLSCNFGADPDDVEEFDGEAVRADIWRNATKRRLELAESMPLLCCSKCGKTGNMARSAETGTWQCRDWRCRDRQSHHKEETSNDS